MNIAYILIRDNKMAHCYSPRLRDDLIKVGYKVVCILKGKYMSFNYTDNNKNS